MRNKVDPRTGKITTGGSAGPLKQERPVVKATTSAKYDLEKLIKEFGEAIVKQITESIVSTNKSISPTYETPNSSQLPTQIRIDESLIDVGIGEQEELITGEGSANLKQEAASDEQLSSAKDKLKALKKS
jgi:hypothetical protein